jgi:hypothetical protein
MSPHRTSPLLRIGSAGLRRPLESKIHLEAGFAINTGRSTGASQQDPASLQKQLQCYMVICIIPQDR